jgi:hypothetical protein
VKQNDDTLDDTRDLIQRAGLVLTGTESAEKLAEALDFLQPVGDDPDA